MITNIVNSIGTYLRNSRLPMMSRAMEFRTSP